MIAAHDALVAGKIPALWMERELGRGAVRGLHPHRGPLFWDRHPTTKQLHPPCARPELVFDAPGLVDDFYGTPLGWSHAGVLALALPRGVYIKPATGGRACRTVVADRGTPLSVAWSGDSRELLVGLDDGDAYLWDGTGAGTLGISTHEDARIDAVAFAGDTRVVATGSANGTARVIDLRTPAVVARLPEHAARVCGLAWSCDGTTLATGDFNGTIRLWDARGGLRTIGQHSGSASVKALAWCPWHPGFLASGGGRVDGRVMFWGAEIAPIETRRQITSVVWSPRGCDGILTSHGHESGATMAVWGFDGTTTDVLSNPDARVLQAVPGPDGTHIAAIAADETLSIWSIWAPPIPPEHRSRIDDIADDMCNLYAAR